MKLRSILPAVLAPFLAVPFDLARAATPQVIKLWPGEVPGPEDRQLTLSAYLIENGHNTEGCLFDLETRTLTNFTKTPDAPATSAR